MLDFLTIAFNETDHAHVRDGRAALTAAGAVEMWRGFWIMAGRCGAPDTQQKLAAVYRAFTQPAHLPPGIIVSPLDEQCEIGIGLSMSEDSRVFYHRFMAADYEKKHGRSNRNSYTFFGDGHLRFAALTERADRLLDTPREVTPLCVAMLRNGSDKALGWHTYTPFYALLVATLEQAPRHVLEIGIGTNYEDVPSCMGRNGSPGASLRAWRDFLPKAQIFGADIDRRVLFEEDRIKTCFVDQLDRSSLARMWEMLPQEQFDLIIDDGLHTIDAAENTLELSLGHLDLKGFYIVEDVLLHQAVAYLTMAQAKQLDGFLIQLPRNVNTFDNCLLVAARKV